VRFGVVGDRIEHSRSPAMHSAEYRYLGIDATYELLPTPRDRFDDVVSRLRDGALDGVNVTMPHKLHAFEAADTVDDSALRLSALNTLVVRDGSIEGFNTDVGGVRIARSRLGAEPCTPVHVLGSGGASAAALVAMEGTGPVSISSRDHRKAEDLRRRLRIDATVEPWGATVLGAIVVNATPIGMAGEVLPQGLVEESVGLIDMAYGRSETPAVGLARRLGIAHADGLVMLAGQACEAFTIFTGRDVPLDIFESAARGE